MREVQQQYTNISYAKMWRCFGSRKSPLTVLTIRLHMDGCILTRWINNICAGCSGGGLVVQGVDWRMPG